MESVRINAYYAMLEVRIDEAGAVLSAKVRAPRPAKIEIPQFAELEDVLADGWEPIGMDSWYGHYLFRLKLADGGAQWVQKPDHLYLYEEHKKLTWAYGGRSGTIAWGDDWLWLYSQHKRMLDWITLLRKDGIDLDKIPADKVHITRSGDVDGTPANQE